MTSKEELEAELKLFEETISNELEYIKTKPWNKISGEAKVRKSWYDLQYKILTRNLDSCDNIKKASGLEASDPMLKKMFAIIGEFVDLFQTRMETYLVENDWMSIAGENAKEIEQIEQEMVFQSEIKGNYHKSRQRFQQIRKSGKNDGVLDVFGDTPIPLMFEEMAIVDFPHLADKMRENYGEESMTFKLNERQEVVQKKKRGPAKGTVSKKKSVIKK